MAYEVPAYTFEFSLPPIECSPNWRGHWAEKSRAVKNYRTDCKWVIFDASPRPLKLTRAVIEMEYRAQRGAAGYHAFDEDNARAATKALVDSLHLMGVIENDSKNFLTWGEFRLLTTKREIEKTGKGPGVTVTLRAL